MNNALNQTPQFARSASRVLPRVCGWLVCAWLLATGQMAVASADGVTAEFENANRLYEQGRFSEAAAAYEKLIQRERIAPALYFNLGNALFKAGQVGRAIVNYRLAEQLSPRDPDIRANLQFARNSVGVSNPPPRWRLWIHRLTLNEWTLLTAGAVWLWFILLTLGQRSAATKKSLRGYTGTVGAVSLLLIACLGLAARERWGAQPAIVVEPQAVIRYGPLDESHSFYTARDGTELTVLDQKGDWLQVTDPANRTGWVRREQVVVLSDHSRRPTSS